MARFQRSMMSRALFVAVLGGTFLAAPTAAREQPGSTLPTTYGDGLRRWTTEDSVSVRYLTRHAGPINGRDDFRQDPSWPPMLWSPDRRHFLLLTYRGNLACDCLRYTLSVYDADQVSRMLGSAGSQNQVARPIIETIRETHVAFYVTTAISEPQWIDNETILFAGTSDSFRQMFRLSLVTGEVEQLTRVTTPYDRENPRPLFNGVSNETFRSGILMFTASESVERPVRSTSYPSVSILSLEGGMPRDSESRLASFARVYVANPAGADARVVASCLDNVSPLSLAPDGRSAAFRCSRIPLTNADAAVSERDLDAAEPSAFWLLDTRTGNTHRVAVTRGQGLVAWREDSHQVALLDALPETGRCPSAEPGTPQIIVTSADGDTSCIGPVEGGSDSVPIVAEAIRWDRDNDLVVTYRERNLRTHRRYERSFSRQEGAWRAGPESQVQAADEAPTGPQPARFNVEVREGANQPWSVVAANGGREVALTEPDPAFEGAALAPVQDISWQEGDFTIHGGMVLPRDYRRGTRVPLVIQAGNYLPDNFLVDGSASTIFAAQALAAQGMAVLNIDISPVIGQRGDRRTEDVFRERIDAIVQTLDQRGLIDPGRVGLVGFSYTGYQAHHLATHPGHTRLGAVIAADSTTNSYGEYVTFFAGAMNAMRRARSNGDYWGGNFWENRQSWIDNAPLFNVQNVSAPILFEIHSPPRVASAIGETVGAYRLLNKPFEYFWFPYGDHQLRMPRERVASMNNNVSWMAFWLQGREIPGLQTEETYARWRRMRQQRDAQPAARPTAAPATQQGDGTAP